MAQALRGRVLMSGNKQLLARISEGEQGGRSSQQPTAVEDITGLMESVRAHLRRLVNARHEMSECVPDYGLPAISDLGGGD